MIGIIPAAGNGSRLGESSKPLVMINEKLLIEYPLTQMLKLGIKKVIIIQNKNDIEEKLGRYWNGISLSYVTQEEKKGSAHAIYLSKDKCEDGDVCVILGDIVSDIDLSKMKEEFYNRDYECLVGVDKMDDKREIMKSYGVRKDGVFIEKPNEEEIQELYYLRGLGFFMFRIDHLFDNIIKTRQNKKKGELDIIDTLNIFLKKGFYILSGKYINVNTREDLELAKNENNMERECL